MIENTLHGRVSRFDGFELDRETGRLTRDGGAVALPEQGFQVLSALLDQAGQPVSREALCTLLWPDDTVGDFDSKLNGVIRKVRIALGDDADHPQYIETLPRRGYRFIGAATSDRVAVPASQPWPARRVLGIGAVGIGVVLLGAVVASLPGRARDAIPRLAVIPFENHAFAADTGEVVARNLTDEITHQLTRIEPSALIVLAPETGRQLGDADDVPYRPNYVVNGSVEQSNDRLRVLVRLTAHPSGTVLWSDTFESSIGDVARMHRNLAEQIARHLRVPLVSVHGEATPVPPIAMEHYWRGRLLWARGSAEELRQAIALFQHARRESSEFVAALVGIADAYNTLALTGGIVPREGFDSARTYAELAIDQNDRPGDAYTALGLSLYLGSWEWEDATRALEHAIRVQPNRFEPHAYLASIHSIHGRHAEAIAESRMATRHNPLAPSTNGDLAWYYYYAGRTDDVIRQVNWVREFDPNAHGLDLVAALTHFAAGHPDAAVSAMRSLVNRRAGPAAAATMDSLVQKDGSEAAWYWWLQRAVDAAQEQPEAIGYLHAVGSAMLGDVEAAVATIERAVEARVSWAPFITVDPAFEMLTGSERYRRIARQMGLHVPLRTGNEE